MYKCLLLSLLLLPGCATGGCSCAAPMLGVFTDANLTVMVLPPNGAAEKAGMQVGDILLDVRLAQLAPGESGDPIPFSDIEAANRSLRAG